MSCHTCPACEQDLPERRVVEDRRGARRQPPSGRRVEDLTSDDEVLAAWEAAFDQEENPWTM